MVLADSWEDQNQPLVGQALRLGALHYTLEDYSRRLSGPGSGTLGPVSPDNPGVREPAQRASQSGSLSPPALGMPFGVRLDGAYTDSNNPFGGLFRSRLSV